MCLLEQEERERQLAFEYIKKFKGLYRFNTIAFKKEYKVENFQFHRRKFSTSNPISIIYMIENNLPIQLCKCGRSLEFISYAKGFTKTCGNTKCIKEVSVKRIKATKKHRYNDENYCNADKISVSNKNSYKLNGKSILEKRNKTYQEKYNCSQKEFLKNAKDRFLEETGFNIQSNHLLNKKDFNKEYILNNFVKDNKILVKECMMHFNVSRNFFENKPFNLKNVFDIQLSNKKFTTLAEREIESFLSDFTFISNDRTLIKPLELDLLNHEYKLAIEYNGLAWHSYGTSSYKALNNLSKEDKLYHMKKTDLVESKGYTLFHIFEDEWINPKKKSIWMNIIKSSLEKNSSCDKIYKSKLTPEIKDFVLNNSLEEFKESEHFLVGESQGVIKSVISYDEVTYIRINQIAFKDKSYLDLINEFRGNIKLEMYLDRRYFSRKEWEDRGFNVIIVEPKVFYVKGTNRQLGNLKDRDYMLKTHRILFDAGYLHITKSSPEKD